MVFSVTSELLVCRTSGGDSAAVSWTTPVSVSSPTDDADRDDSLLVVIDDDLVTSRSATFSYVDDPVISDVISRDSILRWVGGLDCHYVFHSGEPDHITILQYVCNVLQTRQL